MRTAPEGGIMYNAGEDLRRSRLVKGRKAFRVMDYMLCNMQCNNRVYFVMRTIASEIGSTPRTVKRYINELCKAGMIAMCDAGECMVNPDVAYARDYTKWKKKQFRKYQIANAMEKSDTAS